jgi:glycosyltransferase involved in cell wall biosynthesis
MAHGDGTPRCPFPYIVTILDLIPLKFHWLYSREKASWRLKLARWMESKVVEGASGYLTISEASKRDIVSLLGIPDEKVHVTPLGVDLNRFSALGLSTEEKRAYRKTVFEKLGLPGNSRVLLYVGGIDPRKNIPFLLDVFARYLQVEAGCLASTQTFLVIAGRYENDDQLPKLHAEVQRLGIEAQVRFAGFLCEDELLSLYHAAHLFVFPSLYEGFGLPVLEAMACGLPVMAPDNSSIPEVVGRDYPLFRDNDVESWVRGLRELGNSEDGLISMARLGIERAPIFSWDRTAQLTAKAYLAVADSIGLKGRF